MASWTAIEYRAILKHNFLFGLKIDQCLDETSQVLDDNCTSKATIYRWYKQSQRGIFTVEDDPRQGRPTDAITLENVVAVKNLTEAY